MSVKEYKEYKSGKTKKKRVSKKKQKKRRKVKRAFHNLFVFLLVIFLFPAAYFLFWGLIIEPNLPRHIYGPGDLKELIYFLVAVLIMSVSYFMILLINYKPLNMKWWENLKLFFMVRFNLDKYVAMKSMGIRYHRHKKKRQYRHYHSKEAEHKSITE